MSSLVSQLLIIFRSLQIAIAYIVPGFMPVLSGRHRVKCAYSMLAGKRTHAIVFVQLII